MENIDIIEEWRTAVYDGIVYEGLYKVSNLGRILSLNYRNTGKSELMTPLKDKDGYFILQLWKNGKPKTCLVHRLVAFTFLPNPENKPCINHKIEGDEGKKINMVFFNEDGTVDEKKTTIEWATYEENNNYGTRTEKTSKRVLQFSKSGEFIREWPSTAEVGRNGFYSSHVASCCRGERKSHKGFKWMYYDDYKENFGYIPLF